MKVRLNGLIVVVLHSKMGKLPQRSLKGCVVIYRPVNNDIENFKDEGQAELPARSWLFFAIKSGEITKVVSEGMNGHSQTHL